MQQWAHRWGLWAQPSAASLAHPWEPSWGRLWGLVWARLWGRRWVLWVPLWGWLWGWQWASRWGRQLGAVSALQSGPLSGLYHRTSHDSGMG